MDLDTRIKRNDFAEPDPAEREFELQSYNAALHITPDGRESPACAFLEMVQVQLRPMNGISLTSEEARAIADILNLLADEWDNAQ